MENSILGFTEWIEYTCGTQFMNNIYNNENILTCDDYIKMNGVFSNLYKKYLDSVS